MNTRSLIVFSIFFIASFFIGAAPLLLAIGVIWLVAAWQSHSDPPPDSDEPSQVTPPTPPTQYRRPTPPRRPTPHRRCNLTHHKR